LFSDFRKEVSREAQLGTLEKEDGSSRLGESLSSENTQIIHSAEATADILWLSGHSGKP
jgi:hypothetical protein